MGPRPPVIWLNVHRAMHLAIDLVVELSMNRRNLSCAVTSGRPPQSTTFPPRIPSQSTPRGYQCTMCALSEGVSDLCLSASARLLLALYLALRQQAAFTAYRHLSIRDAERETRNEAPRPGATWPTTWAAQCHLFSMREIVRGTRVGLQRNNSTRSSTVSVRR